VERTVPHPIVFRGQTYASVPEMPTEVREDYERALRMLSEAIPTGVPDAWEEEGPGAVSAPGPSRQGSPAGGGKRYRSGPA